MIVHNNILIVDDESSIQRSLKRSLFGYPFNIFTSSNGHSALEILEKEEIDLVISDFKMLEMDGVQFLAKVKESYPSVIRVMFSGYIDKDQLMETLFKFSVVSLHPKPWNEDVLHRKIEEYLKLKNEVEDPKLWIALNSHDLISLHRFDLNTKKGLVDTVSCEPAIYSGLLHLFNSEYFNGGQQLDLTIIENHFSSESILELINKSPGNGLFAAKYSFIQQHSFNLNRLFFTIKEEFKDITQTGNIIPPSLMNLFRYIVWLCDEKLFEELIHNHFFIEEHNNGTFSFNRSFKNIFEYVRYFLKLWNIANPLMLFTDDVLKCIRDGGFSQLNINEKILLLSDYYIEKYKELSINEIKQIMIKEIHQKQLLKEQ